MAFQNNQTSNNAQSQLVAGISAGATSMIITTSEGALFPSVYPFLLTLEQYNASSVVVKREIIKVTNRSADTFTIVRSAGTCVQDDSVSPKLQGTTAYSFDSGDYVSLYTVSEDLKDIKDELGTADNTSNVFHKSGAETVTGAKTRNNSNTYSILPQQNSYVAPTINTEFVTKKYVDDEIIIASSVATTKKQEYVGEDVIAGEFVGTEPQIAQGSADQQQKIGDTVLNTRYAFQVFGSGTTGTTITLKLGKQGTPTQAIGLRIEIDSGGEPSGTLADANATSSVAQASISTPSSIDFILAGSVTLTEGTAYRVVLLQGTYASETIDGTNYYYFYNDYIPTRLNLCKRYNNGYYEDVIDISNTVYTTKNKNVSAQITAGQSIRIFNNGSNLYITDNNGAGVHSIKQYTLTTPYSASTISYVGLKDLSAQSIALGEFRFKDDGTKLYVVGANESKIFQYTLSTPWLVSTATYDTVSFTTTTQDALPGGLAFDSTGGIMYVLGKTTDDLFQYTLSTPRDLSTTSYATKSLDFSSQSTGASFIDTSSDGKKLFMSTSSSLIIYQYSLSTARDISTGSYDGITYSVTQDTGMRGVSLADSQQYFYVMGSASDTVYQYSYIINEKPYYSSTLTKELPTKTCAKFSNQILKLGASDLNYNKGDLSIINLTYDDSQTGLIIGTEYYLSDTAGEISTSAGTNSKKCGIADSNTSIILVNYA